MFKFLLKKLFSLFTLGRTAQTAKSLLALAGVSAEDEAQVTSLVLQKMDTPAPVLSREVLKSASVGIHRRRARPSSERKRRKALRMVRTSRGQNYRTGAYA